MIVNPRRKAPETVSPLRNQPEVEQATIVADAWRERRDAALVEFGRRAVVSEIVDDILAGRL